MSESKDKPSKTWSAIWIPAVVLIVGVLGAIVLPCFGKARATSCANACVNNLRQLDAAINQLALEHHLTNGASINYPNDLTPYIKLNSAGSIPPCPAGGTYSVGKVGDAPACSLGGKVTPAHVLW
jgi:type II secretory pathway pseudopilin PulG